MSCSLLSQLAADIGALTYLAQPCFALPRLELSAHNDERLTHQSAAEEHAPPCVCMFVWCTGEDTLKTREPHPPQNPEVSGPVPAADQTPIPDPSQTGAVTSLMFLYFHNGGATLSNSCGLKAGVGGAGSRPAGVVDGGALDPTKDIPPTEPITGTERGAHQAPRPTHTTDPRN
eukprot:1158167-Pelagomonas_calceolata.AAC.3